ncbi:hypothetical protein ABT143_09970 [Streptomyces sp. NPDC002033]
MSAIHERKTLFFFFQPFQGASLETAMGNAVDPTAVWAMPR